MSHCDSESSWIAVNKIMEAASYSPDLVLVFTTLLKECADNIHSKPPAQIVLDEIGKLALVVIVGGVRYDKQIETNQDLITCKGRFMFINELKQKIILAHIGLNATVRLKGTTKTGSYTDGRTYDVLPGEKGISLKG